MVAECGCKQVDLVDRLLSATDEQVAKALAVSDIAKIAMLEVRAHRMLANKWKARAITAADTAGKIIAANKGKKLAMSSVDSIMKRWLSDVKDPYQVALKKTYKLARQAGHDKATGKIKGSLRYSLPELRDVKKAAPKPTAPSINLSFNLKDDKAISQLSKQEMMWIGDVYENVSPTISDAIANALETGMSAAEAGAAVAKAVKNSLLDIRIPDGFNGSYDQYFEGLAANAVTNARVQGQIQSFSDLGITTYELVNPDDERTTELCHDLNGTVFTTQQAVDNLKAISEAKTPDEYKAAKPWLPTAEIQELLAKGADALAEAGQAFPPYHMKCRTTVDISDGSLDFDSLGD